MMTDNLELCKAFAGIMDEFGPAVYRYALSLTGNGELANDIYQQAFLLLLEKKPKFSHRAQLSVWLMKCVRKIAAAERRRADNSRTVPISEADRPLGRDDSRIEACDFLEFLSVLEEKYREAIVLFYIEDMSIKDISVILGISASAVKTRLSRARNMLEKIYKEEFI